MFNRRILLISIIAALCSVSSVFGGGFFEVVYAQKAVQGDDLDGVLDDSDAMGVSFGYDTEIASTGIFLDIECEGMIAKLFLRLYLDKDPLKCRVS